VFWSKDLLFFEAKGTGSKVTVPFDVAEDGRYEIVAQLAHSPDYGVYTAELDGQATAKRPPSSMSPGPTSATPVASTRISPRPTSPRIT
jgi:hypothetical protein